jgi:hypothetical protein
MLSYAKLTLLWKKIGLSTNAASTTPRAACEFKKNLMHVFCDAFYAKLTCVVCIETTGVRIPTTPRAVCEFFACCFLRVCYAMVSYAKLTL